MRSIVCPYKVMVTNGPYTINGPWQTHTTRQLLPQRADSVCPGRVIVVLVCYDQDESRTVSVKWIRRLAINPRHRQSSISWQQRARVNSEQGPWSCAH